MVLLLFWLGGSIEDDEGEEARYTDEWEMDSTQTDDTHHDSSSNSNNNNNNNNNNTALRAMAAAEAMYEGTHHHGTHQTFEDVGMEEASALDDYKEEDYEAEDDYEEDYASGRSGRSGRSGTSSKPGFNNVLYHGNSYKHETFVSPSKESLRRSVGCRGCCVLLCTHGGTWGNMGKHVCTCCGLLWIVSDLYSCVSLFLCSTFSVFHFFCVPLFLCSLWCVHMCFNICRAATRTNKKSKMTTSPMNCAKAAALNG